MQPTEDKMYDVLIKNALIIDGTGAAAFEADLALKGPKIARVGPLKHAEASLVIDAGGLALAPGFIDMHSHADFSLPTLPTADSLVHQGVTTAVVGQCGLSPAPLMEESREEVTAAISSFFGDVAKSIPWSQWSSFGDFAAFLARRGCSLNIAALVGHGMIRAGVMGFGEGRANADQMARMQQELIAAMQQGAIGLSTGLIYPPGSFTSTDELIELTRAVGERNGFYFSHIRDEGDGLLEAVAEAIRIGRETGAAVQISHFKAAARHNWEKSAQALELIQQARQEGLDVTVDMYPYRAGSTILVAMLPQWAHVGGPEQTLKRLADPDQRRKMTVAMQSGGFARGIGWEDVLITEAPSQTRYEGRTVAQLAADTGKTPDDWVFDALLETRLDITMAMFGMSEENRRREILFPAMMIGSDGIGLAPGAPLAKGVPHPRSYGTFVRVLGRYVRELSILKLEEAIHRMTGLPAKKLRLADRGVIKAGLAADLVIFDPQTVSDRATYEKPHQYAAGISHVLVNGRPVIRDGVHTGARPGLLL